MSRANPHARGGPSPSRRREAARVVATMTVVALLAVTVVTLAGNDPLAMAGAGPGVAVDGGPSAVADLSPVALTEAPIDPSLQPPAPPPVAPGHVAPPTPTSTAVDPPSQPSLPTPADPPPTTADPPPTPGGSPPPPDPDGGSEAPESTVVVSPTLQLLAFGGQVGMPLVCTLAAGSAGPAITDPALVEIVSEIVVACVEYANDGADALRQLDEDLAALAAVNPVVKPLLDELASALDEASHADAPFATYLRQVSALVRFFNGG